MNKDKLRELFMEVLSKYFNAEYERITIHPHLLESDAELQKHYLNNEVNSYKLEFNQRLAQGD